MSDAARATGAAPRRGSTCVGLVAALLAGALTVFGFAPFQASGVPILTVAVVLWLWRDATSARAAALVGFAFGLGLFGTGVSWVFIALETFGGMPTVFALIATAGFVAFLSLYPALAGALVAWLLPRHGNARLLAGAAAFVLAEWLRGFLFTGFPWLALGYSQLPASPLSGFAPIGGVWLVSLAVTLLAAQVVIAVDAVESARWRTLGLCAGAAVALGISGATARSFEWTRPAGPPVPVSLVQGNVAQDLKFDPTFLPRTFERYLSLAGEARGKLVVLPESAFPVMSDDLPQPLVMKLAEIARSRGGDLIFGTFLVEDPVPGSHEPRIYNSVVSVGTEAPQFYRKHHLVPFGETIPLRPIVGWVMNHLLAIPVGDQTPGPRDPPPLSIAGMRVAVNICYEDAFGDELRAGARDAGVLINLTNDAWYGRSIAARQHNQIAAMRALELGRPMLRATNTGITSSIDHHGQVTAELDWFATGILEVAVTPREGFTPYVRFGDALALAVTALLFALAAFRGLRRPGSDPA